MIILALSSEFWKKNVVSPKFYVTKILSYMTTTDTFEYVKFQKLCHQCAIVGKKSHNEYLSLIKYRSKLIKSMAIAL